MFHTPRAMRTRMAYTHTCSTVPRGIDADCSSMSSTTRPACVPMFQERGTPFFACARDRMLYFHMPANVPISHRCQERVDLLQSFQGSRCRMAKQSHGTKEWKTPSMSHGLDLYPPSFLCRGLLKARQARKHFLSHVIKITMIAARAPPLGACANVPSSRPATPSRRLLTYIY
jgi:hypothetical protein